MSNIKFLLLSTLIGAFAFLLIYLIGSFAQASFNINQWSTSAREIVAIMGGVISIAIIPATFFTCKMHEEETR